MDTILVDTSITCGLAKNKVMCNNLFKLIAKPTPIIFDSVGLKFAFLISSERGLLVLGQDHTVRTPALLQRA